MIAVSLTGPKQCRVIETDRPEPDGRHVIIEVSACGICGSDLHFWKHGSGMDRKPGLIMGHEFCGRVYDAGCRDDLSPGDRVTVIPINPCGHCDYCEKGWHNLCREGHARPLPGLNSPGGYAGYCRVRPDMVRRVPDSVSDNEAALAEPAAVALHAVHQAGVCPGDAVLVCGGGPIGHLSAIWARMAGASRVDLAEVHPFRIQFSEKNPGIFSVHDARDPQLARGLRKQAGGFDRVIEASASDQGIHLGISALKPRGSIVLAGINYSPQEIPTLLCTLKEVTIRTSFGYTLDEFDSVLDHLRRRAVTVDFLVTRFVSPDQVQNTFEQMSSGEINDIKTVIHPE